jgi:hypothetical protein
LPDGQAPGEPAHRRRQAGGRRPDARSTLTTTTTTGGIQPSWRAPGPGGDSTGRAARAALPPSAAPSPLASPLFTQALAPRPHT